MDHKYELLNVNELRDGLLHPRQLGISQIDVCCWGKNRDERQQKMLCQPDHRCLQRTVKLFIIYLFIAPLREKGSRAEINQLREGSERKMKKNEGKDGRGEGITIMFVSNERYYFPINPFLSSSSK